MSRSLVTSLLFGLFTWALLILRFGYTYGTGDQIEILPYVIYLYNPHMYPSDFFLRGLNAGFPNERTVVANLFKPFVNHFEIFCFVIHCLTTVILVWGMEVLARRFISNKYLAWLAVLFTLIPFYNLSLGMVDTYSTGVQASSISTCIVIWGINFFLDRRYIATAVIISVATIIHALEGLDVMMVLSAVLLWEVVRKRASIRTMVSYVVIFSFTAGIYLVLMLKAKSVTGNQWAGLYSSPDEFFNIMFRFRHPHHYIFSSFRVWNVLLYTILTLIALHFFRTRSRQVFAFVLISTIGIAFYAVCTDVFQLVFVANFQFYKLTQWVKLLGFVALFGYAGIYIGGLQFWRPGKNTERALLLAGTLTCFIVIAFFRQQLPYKVAYQIGNWKYDNEVIRLCEEVKTHTPLNALFIHPMEITEVKFFAQRGSYVEFKANVKHYLFVAEWYRRLQEVYGMDYHGSVAGFNLQQQADEYFTNLSGEQLNRLKAEGVTHVLTYKQTPPAIGTKVLESNTYAVYQL